MRQLRLVLLLPFALAAACSNSNTGGNTDMGPVTTPTTGGVKGVVTLNGMTTGDSGIVVGVLGGEAGFTDDGGNYALGNLPPGQVTLQASFPGYASATTTVTITAGMVAQASPMNLTPIVTKPMGGLSGHVFLFDGAAAAGSTATLAPGGTTTMTANDGSWTMPNVPAGVYAITFAHNGYVSQTVNNVVVAETGAVTVATVTLTRNSTVVNGHVIYTLASSPDQSLQMFSIDSQIQVVSESTGASVVVGAGTGASGGALAPDDKHLFLTDGNSPGLLWVGTVDGRTLSLVSGRFNGQAWFSADGSHLIYNTLDTSSNTVYYVVSTGGGTPTKIATTPSQPEVASAQNGSGGIIGAAFYTANGTDPNGNAVSQGDFVDADSGNITHIGNIYVNGRGYGLNLKTPFETFVTSASTQSGTTTSIGDLYLWKPGTAPVALSTGTPLAAGSVDTTAPFYLNVFGQQKLVWMPVSNFDTDKSSSFELIDVSAGTVKQIVAHTTYTNQTVGGQAFGNFQPMPVNNYTKYLALDMHNNAGVYSYDLVLIDYVAGTVSLVQANAARLGAGAAVNNENVGNYAHVQTTMGGWDSQRFLIGDTRSATTANATMNWSLFDGMLHRLNPTTAPISTETQFAFSADYQTVVYLTPVAPPTANTTPLTIAHLPAFGTAGDAVAVPLNAAYYPTNGLAGTALSTDSSTVAFYVNAGAPQVSTLYKVSTAASTSAVTPTTLLTNDPSATPAQTLKWVGISGKGDLVFTGDNGAVANAPNAWVVPAANTATPLDANGLGTTQPRVFAIADGARTFVSNESGGNFLVQVDTAATPTITKIANYTTNTARLNGTGSRFFYQSSNGPALTWANSTTSNTVNGSWSFLNFGFPTGYQTPAISYFLSFPASGLVITAFDGGTSVVPLITGQFAGFSYSPDRNSLMFVDLDSSGVRHLVVSPLKAPARTVVVDGLTGGLSVTAAPSSSTFYSPDFSTLYAWGDTNAGTTNPANLTLHALTLATNTVGTLVASGLQQGGAWGSKQTYLFFNSTADANLGTYTAYVHAVGTLTATKQSDNVRSMARSSTDNAGFVTLLADGTSHVASATAGAAAAAFATTGSNVGLSWTGDGSRLVAFDNTNGNGYGSVYVGSAGGAGALYDTYSAYGIPDWTGHNLITVAQHPSDNGMVIDHASIP